MTSRSWGTSPMNKLIRNNCAWGISLLRFSQTCEFWSSNANWRLRFSLPSIILTDLFIGFKRSRFVIFDWWISILFVCFCVSMFVSCDRNYNWRQRKTQLRRRLLNVRVRMFVKSAVTKIILVVLDQLAIVWFNAFYLSVKVRFFVETVSSMIVLFLYRNGKDVNVLPIERKGLLNNSFHARQEMTYILTSNMCL